MDATNFVKTVEQHQHRKTACLEEIAYLNGWICTKEELMGSLRGHEKESVWAVSEGCYGWEISGALVLNKKSYILEVIIVKSLNA